MRGAILLEAISYEKTTTRLGIRISSSGAGCAIYSYAISGEYFTEKMIAQFVGRPLGRSESIPQIIHTVRRVKQSNFSIYFRQLKNRRSRPNGIIKRSYQVSSNRPTTPTLLMFNDTSRGLLYLRVYR
jgi:hypothetical protein